MSVAALHPSPASAGSPFTFISGPTVHRLFGVALRHRLEQMIHLYRTVFNGAPWNEHHTHRGAHTHLLHLINRCQAEPVICQHGHDLSGFALGVVLTEECPILRGLQQFGGKAGHYYIAEMPIAENASSDVDAQTLLTELRRMAEDAGAGILWARTSPTCLNDQRIFELAGFSQAGKYNDGHRNWVVYNTTVNN